MRVVRIALYGSLLTGAVAARAEPDTEDVVWIAAGWFTFGADEGDLEAALCVAERSGGAPPRLCTGHVAGR